MPSRKKSSATNLRHLAKKAQIDDDSTDIYDVLNYMLAYKHRDLLEPCDVPFIAGEEPDALESVWCWDNERMIVGRDCNEWRIEPRDSFWA